MERDGYEKIAYKLLESPKFWFYPDRIKKLTGLTYWAEVEQVMRILSDKEFISKARESYEKLGAKYPSETAKVALRNIKAIEETMRSFKGGTTMTIPKETSYKEYTPKPAWQMTREEYYKPVTLPQGWKNKGYKAIIQKAKGAIGKPTEYIVRVITPDGEMLYPADHLGLTYIRAKYKEDHGMKVKDALERGLPVPPQVLADYPDLKAKYGQIPEAVPRCRVPATLHPYPPPARQFEDEMERLYRKDPGEFYRRKKLVNQAIKEREGGKIKTLPDFSLTDLRRIKAHADSLYG